MQGIILAAGQGSRLHHITLARSKAMLPILGKPIVERIMELLAHNGIDDFILVVSPEDRDIVRHFRESCLQAEVRFVYQPKRLGMANALQCAAPLITGEFVLSACDNLVPAQDVGRLLAFWQNTPRLNAALALMPVEPERLGSVGIVVMDGPWVRRIVEKPTPQEAPSNIFSLPLYIFAPPILDYLPQVAPSPRGEYELQDAIQMLITQKGNVGGLMMERRLTLTSAADLLMINREYLLRGDGQPQIAPHTVGPNTQLVTPLHIEPGAIIGAHCIIGPEVYIERDCCIGNGATIRQAVLLRGAKVAGNATIANQVVA